MRSRIIKFSFLVSLMLVAAIALQAYPGRRGKGCDGPGYGHGNMGGPAQKIMRLQYMLNLTDSQVEKIIDIDAKYKKIAYKNRGQVSELDKMRKNHHAEIRSILDSSQKKKWDELEKRREERWKNRRSGR